MNRSLWIALALLVVGGAAAAAFWWRGADTAALPDTPAFISGQVTQMASGRILVEDAPGKQEGNKCWFSVTGQTRIFRQTGSQQVQAAAADLRVGQQVKAWNSGPVEESYPCQTGAGALLILPN